jgi:hypothetical protein
MQQYERKFKTSLLIAAIDHVRLRIEGIHEKVLMALIVDEMAMDRNKKERHDC